MRRRRSGIGCCAELSRAGLRPDRVVLRPLPAPGKASFFIVTISGRASKTPAIGLSITGPGLTGNLEAAAVAPRPTVKNGKATVRFYIAVANPKSTKTVRLAAAARDGTEGFEAFGSSGQLTNVAQPSVQQVPVKVFDDDYRGLQALGLLWLQDWESKSPPPGTKASDIMLWIIAFGGGH